VKKGSVKMIDYKLIHCGRIGEGNSSVEGGKGLFLPLRGGGEGGIH